MDEQRRRRRVNLNCLVQISHPTFGTKIVRAKDFSDLGLFLLLEPEEIPPLGTIVDGQVQGLHGEDAPRLAMEVVRVDHNGIGLQFLNPNDKNRLH